VIYPQTSAFLLPSVLTQTPKHADEKGEYPESFPSDRDDVDKDGPCNLKKK